MQTYQHSGAVPFSGAVLTGLAGMAAAMLSGAAYTFALFYIPIVYANVLCTLAFGALIGWSGRGCPGGQSA